MQSTQTVPGHSRPPIEQAAIAAFSAQIMMAPDLIGIVMFAARIASVDGKDIVIDRKALMRAAIASGLRSSTNGDIAFWLANWLRANVTPPVDQIYPPFVSGDPTVVAAYAEGFNIVVSQSLTRSVLPAAASFAMPPASVPASLGLREVLAAMILKFFEPSDFADVMLTPDLTAQLVENFAEQIGIPSQARSPSPPQSTRTTTLPGFTSDSVGGQGDDCLEIEADIQAFARLICLKQAIPPLSIGVFGGWGSGKSTFMQRLEGAVQAIVDAESRRRQQKNETRAEGLRFVENVVQIRFNAWQYADANLWASLTAEFFDQLRAGGYEKQEGDLHARLVEQVNAHVHHLSQDAEATNAALRNSEHKLIDAQKARDRAVNDATDEELSQTLIDSVGKVYADHKSEIARLNPQAARNIDDFVKLAKSVRTVPGQLLTIGRSLCGRGWQRIFAVIALVAVVGSLTFLSFSDVMRTASAVLALGSVIAALAPTIRALSTIVEQTAAFSEQLDAVGDGKLKIILDKEEALRSAAEEAHARREAANRSAQALARYVGADSATNPPRLLRYMLEDDPDTKAMEKEIGLIGRARRLFEAVDTIVKAERDRRDRDEPSDMSVPDRIVLYIDDLDRCKYDQVYEVLQALQLLLAFELFVVVVGVDVAWVQDAIARQIEAAPGPDPSNAAELDRARRKRAIAYLEKIFQIPFWLRPLATDGAKGGSYGQYIRGLLAENLIQPQEGTANVFRQEQIFAEPVMGVLPQSLPGTAPGIVSRERIGDEQFAAVEEALATISLTEDEVNFLASPTIGKLAAHEPRGVKRLVNIYRIVRARMPDTELQALLGSAANPGAYPIYALIAAIETGQSLEVADGLYLAMKDIAPSWTPKAPRSTADFVACETVRVLCASGPVAEGFAAVEAIRKRALSAGDYITIARRVRRYSFNKYA